MCAAKRHVCFTPNSDRESEIPQKAMSAYPRKRTCAVQRVMSALGQKRTLAWPIVVLVQINAAHAKSGLQCSLSHFLIMIWALRWKVFGSPGVADVAGGVLREVFLKIPKSNAKARH